MKLMPLDFVRTPKGSLAIVTECTREGAACIAYIGENTHNEHNAWWAAGLVYVDNLPHLLAREMAHPFGDGAAAARTAFGRL